jgi:hypothetical protein
MPSDILPATAITKFIFRTQRVANPEVHSQFYQYLTKKYINMNDTEFQDHILSYSEIDEIKQIYLNGILGFYKLAGPSIRDLTVDGLPGNIDPFEALDEAGSNITKVRFRSCEDDDILRYISQSNQFKSV